MMLRSRYLLVAFVLLPALLQSCSWLDRRAVAKMDVAEELMSERPDSSLTTLRTIKAKRLCQPANRARYALLLTQTQDKNYIDTTDDSLISVAVDYYARKEDPANLFLSLYYKGRIHSNGEDYTNAMLAYTQAEELATHSNDNYVKGLLYAHLGLLYEIYYDFHKANKCYLKSLEYHQKVGKGLLIADTKKSIGRTLYGLQQYEKAEPYLLESAEWAYLNHHHNMLTASVQTLILIYETTSNFAAMEKLRQSDYAKMCEDSMSVLLAYAYFYAEQGDLRKSDTYLSKARKIIGDENKNANENAIYYYEEYRINRLLGNYKEALEAHEQVYYIQDTTLRTKLTQPLWAAQNNYLRSQSDYNQLKLKHNKQVNATIYVILGAVLAMGSIVIRQRIKSKNEEINRYIELAQNLENSLYANNAEMDEISHNVTQMEQQISSLFSSQFELLDKLCTTYFETHNTKREQTAIYLQVKNSIEELRNDKKHIRQLEELVNTYKGNIMQISRRALPELSEMDFHLMCFLYAGFSAKAISIFTSDSTNNIYVKKSRLKNKIAKLDIPEKTKMIELLS